MLEVLFASVDKLRFTNAWDWKSVPITIKHSDMGWCYNMRRVIRPLCANTHGC
jgi:hypothetical protein